MDFISLTDVRTKLEVMPYAKMDHLEIGFIASAFLSMSLYF
jgi:hypothetical protein